jgi:hypothetical protein
MRLPNGFFERTSRRAAIVGEARVRQQAQIGYNL